MEPIFGVQFVVFSCLMLTRFLALLDGPITAFTAAQAAACQRRTKETVRIGSQIKIPRRDLGKGFLVGASCSR